MKKNDNMTDRDHQDVCKLVFVILHQGLSGNTMCRIDTISSYYLYWRTYVLSECTWYCLMLSHNNLKGII